MIIDAPPTEPATSWPAWPSTPAPGTCGISQYGMLTRGSGSSSSTTPPRPEPRTVTSFGSASPGGADRRSRMASVASVMRRSSSAPEAPSDRAKLHALQDLRLLGLELVRRDQALVTEAGQPLQGGAELLRRGAGIRCRRSGRRRGRGGRLTGDNYPVGAGARGHRIGGLHRRRRGGALVAGRGEVRILEHLLLVEHRLLEVDRVGDHREVGDVAAGVELLGGRQDVE